MQKLVLAFISLTILGFSWADVHLAIEGAVANSDRPEAATVRDAHRKPVEVLEFFNINLGMKVLDIFAGGGYYSEILSHTVGASGGATRS